MQDVHDDSLGGMDDSNNLSDCDALASVLNTVVSVQDTVHSVTDTVDSVSSTVKSVSNTLKSGDVDLCRRTCTMTRSGGWTTPTTFPTAT